VRQRCCLLNQIKYGNVERFYFQEEKSLTVDTFWKEFLMNTNKNFSLKHTGDWCFGLPESETNYLNSLILSGKKEATTSCFLAYEIENEPLPQVGEFDILTDLSGNPLCVLLTTAVTILPFKDVTFEICKREGENDTLESWQNEHRQFFIKEGNELGYKFTDDTLVVFEDFKVVYKK
jgi:uncharacterized protein YhfF